MPRKSMLVVALLLAMIALPVACTGEKAVKVIPDDGKRIPLPAADAANPVDLPGVHNLVAYGPGLISGSAPEGDEAFATLRALGIKTIITVDGAHPEVEKAKAYGLRYVHLPISYNGMEESRKLEIARAVKELPGPIYLHCHHGKHRSAAAAGAAAVTLGTMTSEEVVARMKVSGTSANYKGLYKCVESAKADAAGVAKADKSFPEKWKTSGVVDTMVEMDEVFGRLKLIEKAGWKPPKDHPDLVPAAEAGRLADLHRTLRDDKDVKGQTAQFHNWLTDGGEACQKLEDGLLHNSSAADLSASFKLVGKACNDCHAVYRNN